MYTQCYKTASAIDANNSWIEGQRPERHCSLALVIAEAVQYFQMLPMPS